MKQITIGIPENIYLSFIDHIKRKFANIQIKEHHSTSKSNRIIDYNDSMEISLLSEDSLAEDWLTDEDNRWDKVL